MKMTIFLETERLILKAPALSDLDNLIALRTDPEVMKYSENGVQTKEKVEAILTTCMLHYKKYGYDICSVFEKNSGDFIGQAGLFQIESASAQPEIEIGFSLHTKYWGKGYATELVRALIQWGFQNLTIKKLIAVTHPDNVRSHRVLKKFGTLTGKIKFDDEMIPCYEIYKS